MFTLLFTWPLLSRPQPLLKTLLPFQRVEGVLPRYTEETHAHTKSKTKNLTLCLIVAYSSSSKYGSFLTGLRGLCEFIVSSSSWSLKENSQLLSTVATKQTHLVFKMCTDIYWVHLISPFLNEQPFLLKKSEIPVSSACANVSHVGFLILRHYHC